MAQRVRDAAVGTDSGLYILMARLAETRIVRAGALGESVFEKGWYLYVGSARRHRQRRVARHCRQEKTLRWHIDYLLQYAEVREAAFYGLEGWTECELARQVRALPGARLPMKGFGSSDCRCPSHLWSFSRRPRGYPGLPEQVLRFPSGRSPGRRAAFRS